MERSRHFTDMLCERDIKIDWVDQTLEAPDLVEERDDGTRHFLKRIREADDRWLGVVANIRQDPSLLVTAFFDRRMKRRELKK